MLTVSDDRTARLWDARNGEPVGEPMDHPGAGAGGIGTGDDVVWTLADDGLVRLWQIRTQKPIGPAWTTTACGRSTCTPSAGCW